MRFVETPVFTKTVVRLLTHDDYRAQQLFYMLFAYPKNEQEDLTPEQLRTLRGLVRKELK